MTEAILTKLRREFCVRFVDTLNDLLEQAENDPAKLPEARLQYGLLPDRIRDFESYHAKVMALPENESKQDDLFREYDDFNAKARGIQVKFENPPFRIETHQPQFNQSDMLNAALHSQLSTQSQSYARLPKLDLPHFAGDIANWNSFYDLFNSSIHNNDSLKSVQKFQYLRSVLKGETMSLVKNLALTDDNYLIARKLLENRYAHKRLISSYHLQTLIDLPKPIPMTYKAATKFVAAINEHTEALKANQEPVDSWSPLLAFILVTKLDKESRNHFERTLNKDTLPSLTALLTFLDKFIQSQQWQSVNHNNQSGSDSKIMYSRPRSIDQRSTQKPLRTSAFVSSTNTLNCILCSNPHTLFKCTQFHQMKPSDRLNIVRTNNCCRNCLSSLHSTQSCQSKINCRRCNKRHHTMLHLNQSDSFNSHSNSIPLNTLTPADAANDTNVATTSALAIDNVPGQTTLLSHSRSTPFVLLGTAVVLISDCSGSWQPVRALLDSGSESSYITSECAKRLKSQVIPANISVSGFGDTTASNIVQGTTTLRMHSMHQNSPIYILSTIVVSHIVRNMPKTQLPANLLSQFNQLQLADPNFTTPAPIELLIGADLYFNLLTGHKNDHLNGPTALETTLGWIISGPVDTASLPHVQTLLTVQNSISETLSKVWELEEIPKTLVLSNEDRLAEDTFVNQHTRLESGRYVVPLLFKQYPIYLGNSYSNAVRCFNTLQRRLLSDDILNSEYHLFMKDYLTQNHMSLLAPELDNQNEGFYLPHHGVLQNTNSTRKLRVVFNGSKRTPLNTSLNENLLTGPALQTDLTSIILRSRFHKVIFTADIRQMYRQILISDDYRIYQKILWSFDHHSPPQTYLLNTVTYGTTSAHQLAEDEKLNFPNAAKAVLSDTYVDDIITGADSLSEACNLQQELIQLLKTAGLELRKWTSNHPTILKNIPEEYRDFSFSYDTDRLESVQILGLTWNPLSDQFTYKINLPDHPCTKRTILSDIARIFDPLGWLSPMIMVAKQMMQELWISGTDWDSDVPEHLKSKWNLFRSQLSHLNTLSIPRYINNTSSLNLAGFCDASEKGYAAVVYFCSEYSDSKPTQSFLIAAKTKVAPIKRISLPRLELCAALLLSRLISNILEIINFEFANIFAWSDSTITLSWIRAPPYKWKTFVSNRVAEIQERLPQNHWHHIRSQDNPADCASRGISIDELTEHPLWWVGPSWLRFSYDHWPINQKDDQELPNPIALEEEKKTLVADDNRDDTLLNKYSQLDKLLRTTVLCTRFFNKLKRVENIQHPFITVAELDQALLRWVKVVQQEVFRHEIDQISRGRLCHKPIQNLCPFLDDDGLLRVGGRIRHSALNYNQKHPLLLPSQHRFTHLVIDYHHKKYLHPSPRTLQAILNRKFWILAARRVIRSYSIKCIDCFRFHPVAPTPQMGNLPENRVTQMKPFDVVGVDYGGPFHVTPYKKKGFKSTKAYLCLFICFTTKALHLELASDLSTEAFILAFRRFLARRGRCSHIYSDSGTNFVGTKSYFTELQSFVTSSGYNQYLANRLAADGTQWHLNPPSAPHFGGLWEAGIKSVKFHISRVIGVQVLTYEEFYTLLCQIESILNSRPLCPLSSDPNDVHALTPNHFIVLEAAVCLPDRDYLNEPEHRLTRWQLLQKIQQEFWKRWHHEYLNTLQQRSKWTRSTPNLEPNQLVLIKNELLPPLQWKLGRILDVHAGNDGVVRVAKVRTASGIFTRPVVKLCPLPRS